ncbi:osomolarity two-component system, response regulator SSK1 [Entomortierella parvispora]|uniref:Osomolarity two-component system, response regulator SSK1 n=1 Tax=Entomortierella parvispora TaxID=205924 RepID=A0A9P3LZD2_9FUNG|nr:osomolarity two-component system, response regulator SSK1 [Entomortierella parvispora]
MNQESPERDVSEDPTSLRTNDIANLDDVQPENQPSSASLPPSLTSGTTHPESANNGALAGHSARTARFKVRDRPVQLIRNMHANYFNRPQQPLDSECKNDSRTLETLTQIRHSAFAYGATISIVGCALFLALEQECGYSKKSCGAMGLLIRIAYLCVFAAACSVQWLRRIPFFSGEVGQTSGKRRTNIETQSMDLRESVESSASPSAALNSPNPPAKVPPLVMSKFLDTPLSYWILGYGLLGLYNLTPVLDISRQASSHILDPLLALSTLSPLMIGSLNLLLDYITNAVVLDVSRHNVEKEELLNRHATTLDAFRDENLLKKNILLETVGKEVQDAATLAIETLRQMTPTSLFPPSVSREQLSPCTLPIPITTLLGFFTTMRHLQYISRNMQRLSRVMFTEYVQGIVEKTSPHYHRGENKFDVGEFVQSLGDLVSADASLKGVEFVIYHSEYDMNHVPIKGSEESWRHALINLIKSIIDSAKSGSTVELCLAIFALPQTEIDKDKVVVSFEITYRPNRFSTSTEDDLAQLNALLASKLVRAMGGELEIEQLEDRGRRFIVSVEVEMSHSSSEEKSGIQQRTMEEQHRAVHPLDATKAEGFSDTLQGQDTLQRIENMQTSHPVHESQQFFQHHIRTPMIAASPSPSSPPPKRIGAGISTNSKVSAEPTVSELIKFSRKLSGLKVSLLAKEHSAFAVRLSGYLKVWGIQYSRKTIQEEGGSSMEAEDLDGAPSDEHQTPGGAKRSGSSASLNSKVQTGSQSKETISPAKSSGSPAFIMIDDDIKTLSQQIMKLQHSNQPSTPGNLRRSTHRRHKSISSIQHTSIIYFTSLPTFKQARDTIMFILGTQMPGVMYSISHTMSGGAPPHGPLPYILVLPKPVGPRRVLTAIHTAINVPVLDQSYSPIATAPTSPAPLIRHFSEEINPLDRDQIVYDPVSLQAFARAVPNSSQSSPGGVSPNNTVPQDQRQGREMMRQLIDAGKNSGSIAYPFDLSKEILSPETPGSTHTIGSPTGILISGSGNQIAGIEFDPTARPSGTLSPSLAGPNNRRISNGSTSRLLNSDGVVILPPNAGPGTHQSFTLTQPYRPFDGQGPSAIPAGFARMAGQYSRTGGTRSPLGTPPTIPPSNGIDFSPPTVRHTVVTSPLPQRAEPSMMRGNSGSSSLKSSSIGSLNSNKNVESPKGVHPTLPHGSIPLSSTLPVSPGSLVRLSPSGVTGVPTTHVASPQPSNSIEIGRSRSGNAASKKSSTDSKSVPSLIKSGVVERVSPLVNVLIVEDNKINQTILVKFMKQRKIKYEVACNGREAVDKWRVGGFHLVLMDIQMPVMDGIQATREIRRLEKSQKIGVFPTDKPSSRSSEGALDQSASLLSPKSSSAALSSPPASPFRSPVIIVALTATEDTEESRNTALLAGCNDYITKPIGFAWLERKIVDWGCMQALIDVDAWKEWKKGLDGTSPGNNISSLRPLGGGDQSTALTKAVSNIGVMSGSSLKRPSISARSIKGNKAAAAAAVAANKSLMAANAAAALAASAVSSANPSDGSSSTSSPVPPAVATK